MASTARAPIPDPDRTKKTEPVTVPQRKRLIPVRPDHPTEPEAPAPRTSPIPMANEPK